MTDPALSLLFRQRLHDLKIRREVIQQAKRLNDLDQGPIDLDLTLASANGKPISLSAIKFHVSRLVDTVAFSVASETATLKPRLASSESALSSNGNLANKSALLCWVVCPLLFESGLDALGCLNISHAAISKSPIPKIHNAQRRLWVM